MDSTTRLGLNKPNGDPETGDYVDIDKLNENADKVDAAISTTVCTSSTRPTTPFQGQLILETDTGRIYVWLGSWIQVPTSGSGRSLLGFIDFERPVNTDGIVTGKVTGDTIARFVFQADGGLQLGSGSAGRDTNLYRGGANLLKTDDAFQAVGPLNAHLAAVKGGNTTRPSTTTLADDPHLAIDVEANATYIMDGQIIYYAAAAVDIQVGWSGPASASMEWNSLSPSEAATTPAYEGVLKYESRNIGQTQNWGGTGVIIVARPSGCLQTAGLAGTFRFRWTQRVSNADATIVYAKSYIRLHRVA